MTVSGPFDLEGVCKMCDITLSEVSESTGIPEDELRAFAAGNSSLRTGEWFGIMRMLDERAQENTTSSRPLDERIGLLLACRMLLHDLRDEEREEDERLGLI